MKQIPAIVAALIITGFTGLGIFAIGSNAYLNTNTSPVQEAPNSAANSAVSTTLSTDAQAAVDAASQAQIKQLQDLVAQYQTREKQYQTELTDAAQKLKDATGQAQQSQVQVQQYQDILMQLQQRGVIRVTSDGQIMIPRRGGTFNSGGDTQ